MTITLYSLCGTDAARPFSPHCWKAVMALHHKGLAFEERPLAFTAIPAVENGFSKTVPILRDGTELVSDSFRIALYLEEAYPEQPSLFGGPGGLPPPDSWKAIPSTSCTRRSPASRWSIYTTCWPRPTRPISAQSRGAARTKL